jgi:parallel beta-helix repeat protein
MGEGRDTTIIDGSGSGDVVYIYADWVNITGFTVTGSGSNPGDSGIELDNVQNCRIINNNVSSNNGSGIFLYSSNKNIIIGNNASNNFNGIGLQFSNENNITGNTVSLNDQDGIALHGSSKCKINDNYAQNNRHGIHLSSANIWNTINGNNASSNSGTGIFLYFASNENTINGNNASNNGKTGIEIAYSYHNTITDNNIFSNDEFGAHIRSSIEINMTNNTMINDGIFIEGDSLEYWNTHHIDTSNIINGKPIYYWKNQTGGIIPPGAGEVILANCSNVIVENQELNYSTVSVELGFSFNNHIIGNNASLNGRQGIYLYSANGNNITGNNFSSNGWYSIDLRFSNANKIYGNNVLANSQGNIRLTDSNGNNIIGNKVLNSGWGIMLWSSGGNKISSNDISSNIIGIHLRDSNGNIITDSDISSNSNIGIYFWGSSSTTIDNCTINNSPTGVYFLEQSMDNMFINSSISNSGNYDFYFSELNGGNSHATTLNTTFNKTRVYYGDNLSSGGFSSSLTVKWFMHVKVIYWNGSPVTNAEIWVNDTFGTNILSGQTDFQGWKRWIIVMEYIEQDTTGDHIGNRFYFTPHDVTATDGNLWGYAYPNMDISKVVLIILGAPPPLLPPTNLTTKVVNNSTSVELEWDPPSSLALDHYLIYKADSATEFDFTTPYNRSTTWPDPKNTTWIDPDPNVIAVDDDFYYIVRAANFDESDVSLTSNTAGIWTRTFQSGISTFSLPLEPFVKKDTEFYCQDMNASYINWMNQTTHTWTRHDKGSSENNTIVEIGKGYEIGFLGKSIQTKYTFTGMPGAMILYDNVPFGFDATPLTGNADSLTATVDSGGNVTLNWTQPANMGSGDRYYVLRSTSRDGFWGTLGVNYTQLAVLPFDVLSYQDIGNATAGTEYYYMIVPVNLSTAERGLSSYSIGVWTASYLDQYDTFALPLKPSNYQTADWYCDKIPNTVGINYYIYSGQRWSWHSTRMPQGAYDPILEMTEGYQISTSVATKYTFIGH